MWNSNFFHNVSNVLMAVLSALTAFLMATGCTTAVADALDCSGSWIDLSYTTLAVTVLAVMKVVVNIVRDGIGGLAKQQPPVASNTTTVVVASDAEAGPAKVQVSAAQPATNAPAAKMRKA